MNDEQLAFMDAQNPPAHMYQLPSWQAWFPQQAKTLAEIK
jgi:hypothetical protein